MAFQDIFGISNYDKIDYDLNIIILQEKNKLKYI